MAQILWFDTRFLKNIPVKIQQIYCILNVTILGLIYGFSAAYFSRIVLIESGFEASSINFVKIILAGVPIAFLMHAGASLFIWVFLKAIGGKNNFIGAYFNMGLAAISLWPVAPFAAAFQSGIITHSFIIGLASATIFYGFAVNFMVLKTSYQLPRFKMITASLVSILYIGCFLYLWV